MGIPENSIKQYKIGEKQIVVGNNDRNVELDNLHIVEEFDAFTDPYDKNGDFRISTKSYASIFMNDINELIGNDNEITDAEIEAYIEKKNGYDTIDDVKNALIDIFSLKKSPKFQEMKSANGEIVNEDIRTIKIGDKKIYIGNEITESIDISKYCSKGYCDNDFLSQFINKETKQIDFEIEATKLYELIDRLSINGEITDEAIENYINETPSLKNYNPKWIKEFLIQAFPPPKTEEEKQQYFAANEARIKKITGVSNLMNEKTTDELVNIAKDIGADKYFHSKANCEASQLGDFGEITAKAISDLRELTDSFKNVHLKGMTEAESAKDSADDEKANKYGRNQGRNNLNENCGDLVEIYRPNGLPTKY